MDSIDLHGVLHRDVSDIIDKSLWDAMKLGKREIKIITGNSDKMKKIVSNRLSDYGFHFSVGDPINKGYILVFLK